MTGGLLPAVARRWRRRRGRAGQSGLALMAGLLVWVLLCGVTLVALMGMTLSASRISLEQAADARRTRAADAALQAAVTRIRMDPDARIGAAGAGDGRCATDGDPFVHVTDDGTTVVVTAECERTARRVAEPAPGEALTNAAVDVVGDRYRSPEGLADTVRWTEDCAGTTAPGCYPWRAAIGGPYWSKFAPAITDLPATVVHTSDPSVAPADAALAITGDLNVRRTAAPLVNPPRGDGTVGITVAGAYRQGDPGPLAEVGGSGSCGLLAADFPWVVPGAAVTDSDDRAGAPTCTAKVPSAVDGLPAPTRWVGVAPVREVPACPKPGQVAALQPGAYTRLQTAALNDLLGGGCPGRVIWFTPGDYWIDVDDRGNRPEDRHALVIDDSSIRVILGRPAGGADAAAAARAEFPDACDRGAPGVSVTLSPRTSLRHRAGRLAVCDRTGSAAANNLPPVLWQAPDAQAGWSGTPDPRGSSVVASRKGSPNPLGSSLTDGPAAWVIDDRWATASAGCGNEQRGNCGAVLTFSARGIGADTPVPSATVAAEPVASLDLLVRSAVPAADKGNEGGPTTVEVALYPAGSPIPACAAVFDWVPDLGAARTATYDLFSPQAGAVAGVPRCRDVRDAGELTRGMLRGARVDLSYRTGSVAVDGMVLVAGWNLSPLGAADAGGWAGAGEVLVADGRVAEIVPTCTTKCPAVTATLELRDLDNLTSPHVPTDGRLRTAGLVLTGDTVGKNSSKVAEAPAGSVIRAELALADGRSCSVTWPWIPLGGEGLYLDLLAAGGDCARVLDAGGALLGATVRLQVSIGAVAGGRDGTRLDAVTLLTVTDGAYTGPAAPYLLSQDAGEPGSASGTSANVFGPVSIPRGTLNVVWAGRPPERADGAAAPVLGGRTVVGAVGSRVAAGGRAGVLCCTGTRPAERVVALSAAVLTPDGRREPVGSARVRVGDADGPGSSVTVEAWRLGSSAR
jgi:hypothetical protein